MAFVEGGLKRLEIIRSAEGDELRKKLFTVTRALQDGFRKLGFDIGPAEACVTPVAIKGEWTATDGSTTVQGVTKGESIPMGATTTVPAAT